MDSITQATLGAAIGEALLGKKLGYKAALGGAVMGTIPDLDIILYPFLSELQEISIHRGYSHSILFCFLAAFISAWLLSRIRPFHTVGKLNLAIFSFLVYLTHVILDAFTTYGTQLFLPFSDLRVSFDSINIVDPVYTLPLLAGLLISLFKYDPGDNNRYLPNLIGISVSTLYLAFTLVNKQEVNKVFLSAAADSGISVNKLLTVPVKAGNFIWYGVAKDDSTLHIANYNQIRKDSIEFSSFPINDHLLEGLDATLVNRMKWFAQGFYTVAEKDGHIRIYNMQCDMQGIRRYGDYVAPTAFYFQVDTMAGGAYEIKTGMHMEEK